MIPEGRIQRVAAARLETRVLFESTTDGDGVFYRAIAFDVEGPWMRSMRGAFGALLFSLAKTEYLFKQLHSQLLRR